MINIVLRITKIFFSQQPIILVLVYLLRFFVTDICYLKNICLLFLYHNRKTMKTIFCVILRISLFVCLSIYLLWIIKYWKKSAFLPISFLHGILDNIHCAQYRHLLILQNVNKSPIFKSNLLWTALNSNYVELILLSI